MKVSVPQCLVLCCVRVLLPVDTKGCVLTGLPLSLVSLRSLCALWPCVPWLMPDSSWEEVVVAGSQEEAVATEEEDMVVVLARAGPAAEDMVVATEEDMGVATEEDMGVATEADRSSR